MNNLSTRQWSTPATIAAGTFVSVSGVMMFFGVHNPLELAHEWIGLIFAAAIVFHMLNHWRAVRNYFPKRIALGVVGAVAIAASTLIAASAAQEGGDVMRNVIRSVEGAPLVEVAALLDQSAENLVAKFEAAGYAVESAGESINAIAASNGAQPKTLMLVLFNEL
jgi:hypothetical protein